MTGDAPRLSDFYHLIRLDKIGSTNDEAKRLAREEAPEGTLVWAAVQTAGRGRRGRSWLSPRGNLYLSLLLRPTRPAPQAAQLGFVTALAFGEALLPLLGSQTQLSYKWPNDVLINQRKVAGILLESETEAADIVKFVVIGMGVNIAIAPEGTEFPATSLVVEGVAGMSPGLLLAGFAHHFEYWYGRWYDDGFPPVRQAWLERAGGIGEPVQVRLERATLLGRFLDIDNEGALLLETEGRQRRIAAGEIFPAMMR
jgi:BirA family biotin operon repressor/biotin-[acetyl-CoA-carboxylase] ligase